MIILKLFSQVQVLLIQQRSENSDMTMILRNSLPNSNGSNLRRFWIYICRYLMSSISLDCLSVESLHFECTLKNYHRLNWIKIKSGIFVIFIWLIHCRLTKYYLMFFFYLKIFSNNSFNKLEIMWIENIYLNVRLLRIHFEMNIGSEQNKREILMRISEVASIT